MPARFDFMRERVLRETKITQRLILDKRSPLQKAMQTITKKIAKHATQIYTPPPIYVYSV